MKKSRLLFIIFINLILLFGCTNQNENTQEFKQKDKAPESLAKLTKNLDDMLTSIGEIERVNLNIPSKEDEKSSEGGSTQGEGQEQKENQQKDSENQGQGQNQGEGQNQGQSGGQNQSKGGGAQQTPEAMQEKLKQLWDKIQTTLEEAHKNWNSYESEALKKGATQEQCDRFEAAFNKLTVGVENKNLIEIYDFGSQSYFNLKPFFDLYTDEFRGDMSVLKYAAYKAYISAVTGEKEKAEEILNGRDENINKIRMKIENEDEKTKVDKLALSLMDFRDALKENSRTLYMIKKDVIIQSINEIKE